MLRVLKYKSNTVTKFSQVKILVINILTIKINRSGSCLHQTVQMLDQS